MQVNSHACIFPTRKDFSFYLKPNHKPTLCVKQEEINARERGLWDMNVISTVQVLISQNFRCSFETGI
jgi:hypothetical protein